MLLWWRRENTSQTFFAEQAYQRMVVGKVPERVCGLMVATVDKVLLLFEVNGRLLATSIGDCSNFGGSSS